MAWEVQAQSAAELVAELRRLRADSGQLSFRELNRIAKQQKLPDPLSPSTTSEILTGKRLPRLPRLQFIESYVTACLIAAELPDSQTTVELARWRELWRSLARQTPADPVLDEVAAGQEPSNPEPLVAAPSTRGSGSGRNLPDAGLPIPAAPRSGLGSDRWSLPRRWTPTWPLVVTTFLVGIGMGLVGGRAWAPADAASEADHAPAAAINAVSSPCLPAIGPDPVGQDVLDDSPWWVNRAGVALRTTSKQTFRADVSAGTPRPGDLVVIKSHVRLVSGQPYTVAFTAMADRATEILVRAQDMKPPSYTPSLNLTIAVGPNPCRQVHHFTAATTSDDSELTIQVGGRPHDFELTVSDVVLVNDESTEP